MNNFNYTKSIPYYNELVEIRLRLEQAHGFPKGYCIETTALCVERIPQLIPLAGVYMPTKSFHAWLGDEERELYIDITIDQFKNEHDEITILQPINDLLEIKEKNIKIYSAIEEGRDFKENMRALRRLF